MSKLCKAAAVMTGLIMLTAGLVGCASQYPYEELDSINAETYNYYYIPDFEQHHFDRKATVEEFTFYYESSLGGKVDGAIKNVLAVRDFCEITQPIYLSERAVTHADDAEFWVNIKDEATLIGATYLAYLGNNALPFGCYAGASAFQLGEKPTHTDNSLVSALRKNPNAKELQYPFFTQNYGKSAERKAAWGLAQAVAEDYLSSHTLEDLLKSETSEWGEIFQRHGAEIPTDFNFSVGDTPYPIQITTASFHYHFAFDYTDRYYKDFNTDYNVLKDFVIENEAFVGEVSATLSVEEFPQAVDVYFLSNLPYGGYYDFHRNAIVCTGVYIFSSGAADWTMYHAGVSGQMLDYALSQYFPYASENTSWFQRVAYISLYQGTQIKDRITGENSFSDAQLRAYKICRKLYEYNFGKATQESFDALKMAAVVAALEPNRREAYESSYSWTRFALVDYLCDTYGMDAVLELSRRWTFAEIGDKSFEDIYEEFQTYLDSLLEENIAKEYQELLESLAK